MKIFNSIDSISPIAASVVTIGNFDGVHIGHQALFHTVIEKAEALSAQSIAITFEPHPIRVLKPNHHPPLITLYDQKTELIASAGIEALICIPFTRAFAAMSANAFVQDFLVSRIGMKAIVAGRDYTFGKNREGDIAMLRQTGDQLGFETVVVDWVQLTDEQGRRISSTRIRQLVSDGQLDQAQKLLGRYYQIKGVVATGRNRGGKLLGFPTANINLHDELCPKVGVYAVTVQCLNQTLPGVANIGYSPTFDDHIFTVEVHILDFDQDIYGHEIRVNFIRRIRDEIKFSSIDALAGQIKQDVDTARRMINL